MDPEDVFEPAELADRIHLVALNNAFNTLVNNLTETGIIGRKDIREIDDAFHQAIDAFPKNETLAHLVKHHNDYFAAILTKASRD